MKKVLFLFLLGSGVFVLTQVILPLIQFKVWELTSYKENQPLVSAASGSQVLGVSVQASGDFYSDNHRNSLPYPKFSLSIPSLGLKDLPVKVDSNDFDDSLAQLPGTALPGERGNVFITGHSSLTQFFTPTNFKAIFAHLTEIKKGDLINVTAGGQNFTYEVKGLQVVDPKDVSVINPPDPTGRYLTLMTCTPPGLTLYRLIVLAELR